MRGMRATSGDRWTRRQVLRGAGIALALPWLETFAPRTARAQAAGARRRLVTLYFSNGTAAFWTPTGTGSGDAWKLSPIMAPLAPVKTKLLTMSNVSNTAPFVSATDPDGMHPTGSHGALSASTWTASPPNGPMNANNGISVDQAVADTIAAGPNPTTLHSLQVGLSTVDSFTDGLPAQHSRSMSWKSASEPLYKVVNPQAVFDRLVAGRGTAPSAGMNMTPAPDPLAERRRALRKSSLDYIQESSLALQARLSTSDRQRMDQFLSSVRSLELRVQQSSMAVQSPVTCASPSRPPAPYAVAAVPADYSRETHAGLMTDLTMMALTCDITRVVSYMLDDARSEFVYKFLTQRNFTVDGSVPGQGGCDQYHAMQHAGETNNQFATIGWWMAQKASDLAGKLAAVSEGAAGTMLDNTVIVFASGMHGASHKGIDIPVAILGSGGGVLKQDTYLPFATEQQMGDLHLTLIQKVFGGTQTSFGASMKIIPELLA
jgi:hypothetical protein